MSIRLLGGTSTPIIRAINQKLDWWIIGLVDCCQATPLRYSVTPILRFIYCYPCRCLWRSFVQMTRMTPLRRMILQFSQSFLTDARTFIKFFRFGFGPQSAQEYLPKGPEIRPKTKEPVNGSFWPTLKCLKICKLQPEKLI